MDYAIFEDYYNYIIFMNGKIFSLKSNIFMKSTLNNNGYYVIGLRKNKIEKKFLLHRILAICFIKNTHNLPTIDHIDINPKNNKINNLRWSSSNLQNINKNIQKNNKTGTIGVHFHKITNSYIATWRVDKKMFQKSFPLKKYENAKQLATDYRAKMVEKHYTDII
jgi:hypothetical protein